MKRIIMALLAVMLFAVSSFAADYWQSAASGDLDGVKRYVEKVKINIDQKDANGFTALHRAAYQKRTDVVRYLIEKGCDINALDPFGAPAICYTIDNFDIPTFNAFLNSSKLKLGIEVNFFNFCVKDDSFYQMAAQASIVDITPIQVIQKEGKGVFVANIIDYAFAAASTRLAFEEAGAIGKLRSMLSIIGVTSPYLYDNSSYLPALCRMASLLDIHNKKYEKLEVHIRNTGSLLYAALFDDVLPVQETVKAGGDVASLAVKMMVACDSLKALDYLFETDTIVASSIPKYLSIGVPYNVKTISYLCDKGLDPSMVTEGESALMDSIIINTSFEDLRYNLMSIDKPSRLFASSILKTAQVQKREDVLTLMANLGFSSASSIVLNEKDILRLIQTKDAELLSAISSMKLSPDYMVSGKTLTQQLISNSYIQALVALFGNVTPGTRKVASSSEAFWIAGLADPKLTQAYLTSASNISEIKEFRNFAGENIIASVIISSNNEDMIIETLKVLGANGFEITGMVNPGETAEILASGARRSKVVSFLRNYTSGSGASASSKISSGPALSVVPPVPAKAVLTKELEAWLVEYKDFTDKYLKAYKDALSGIISPDFSTISAKFQSYDGNFETKFAAIKDEGVASLFRKKYNEIKFALMDKM